jgi:hypothetical protein
MTHKVVLHKHKQGLYWICMYISRKTLDLWKGDATSLELQAYTLHLSILQNPEALNSLLFRWYLKLGAWTTISCHLLQEQSFLQVGV